MHDTQDKNENEQKIFTKSRQIARLRINHANVNFRIRLEANFCDFLQFGERQLLLSVYLIVLLLKTRKNNNKCKFRKVKDTCNKMLTRR